MISNKVLFITRTFATKVKDIPVPVQVFGVDGRYATSLYKAAVRLNQLDAVEKDMNKIKISLEDRKLSELITKGTEASVKDAVSMLNLTTPVANFLLLLAENGRTGRMEKIIKLFSIIMGAHRGDLRCIITTAEPLNEENKKFLLSVLKSYATKGEDIVLELKVNPDLIGGMLAHIGNYYIDLSISSKVKKYTELISAKT